MTAAAVLERVRVGTARRVTMAQARAHHTSGGTVLVSERGHESEMPVWTDTTVHGPGGMTWHELADMVTMWRGRYPGQRFYIVTYPACTFPPARVTVESVRRGDVLPMCGKVSRVDVSDGRRVVLTFEPDAARPPISGRAMFYPGELVHVSREVTA